MNPPRPWTNPILLWWTLAAVSFGAIVLLRPALIAAIETPRPYQTTKLTTGEIVRLCREDSDIMTNLSWEYFGNGNRATGPIGMTGYETNLTKTPIQVIALNPTCIVIVDPDRNELLAAIDTSNMPPRAITHFAHSHILTGLTKECGTRLGLTLKPNREGVVRRWRSP